MTDTCETCRFWISFEDIGGLAGKDGGCFAPGQIIAEATDKGDQCREHQPRQEGGEG